MVRKSQPEILHAYDLTLRRKIVCVREKRGKISPGFDLDTEGFDRVVRVPCTYAH